MSSLKYRIWVWLALGGVPLVIYPVVLLANVMSLAAEPSAAPASLALRLSSQAFLWSSTLYPLIYTFFGTRAIFFARRGDYTSGAKMSVLPLLYLAMVAAFMCAWMIFGA